MPCSESNREILSLFYLLSDTANVLHEPRPSNCVSTLLELSLRTSHGLGKRFLRARPH